MNTKQSLIDLAKLLACGLVFHAGMQLGGIVASFVGLQAAPMAPGVDRVTLLLYSLLASPLLALALAAVARRLAGSLAIRAAMLSFLIWVSYSICDQLEGLLVSIDSTGFWFAIVASLPASLLCGGALAYFFPAAEEGQGFVAAWKALLGRRRVGAWIRRALVASVAFAPVYFAFGLLVLPFVRPVYEQGLYGLREPAVDRLVAILFARSVLFTLSCAPILIAWQGSRRSLFLRLGFALFVLVAYPSVFVAYWLPLGLRLPHSLEILADEFVYAGVLVALLTVDDAPPLRAVPERKMPQGREEISGGV